MRDLGKAVIEAARDLAKGFVRPAVLLGCHLHFVKDIGKDLLRSSHEALRELFRRFSVQSRLRAFARDLGRGLGADIGKARRDVADWLAGRDEDSRLGSSLPMGAAGLAAVRALGQWILDYQKDGTDAGFPFDRPFLDLYRRCLRALRAIDSLLRKGCDDARVLQALKRLHSIVAVVHSELPFQLPARTLERRALLQVPR